MYQAKEILKKAIRHILVEVELDEERKSKGIFLKEENLYTLLKHIYDKYGFDKAFVSFRESLHVTRINPKNKYDTPTGLYGYKLSNYLTTPDKSVAEFTKRFPFASERKYAQFFILKDDAVVFDSGTSIDVLDKYVKKIENLYPDIDPIQGLCKNWFARTYKSYYSDDQNPAHRFWLFLYSVASYFKEEKRSYTFSQICRKIGVDGFDDDKCGGWIHPSEKCQSVFLRSNLFKDTFEIELHKENDNTFYNKAKNPFIRSTRDLINIINKYPRISLANILRYIPQDDEGNIVDIKDKEFIKIFTHYFVNSIVKFIVDGGKVPSELINSEVLDAMLEYVKFNGAGNLPGYIFDKFDDTQKKNLAVLKLKAGNLIGDKEFVYLSEEEKEEYIQKAANRGYALTEYQFGSLSPNAKKAFVLTNVQKGRFIKPFEMQYLSEDERMEYVKKMADKSSFFEDSFIESLTPEEKQLYIITLADRGYFIPQQKLFGLFSIQLITEYINRRITGDILRNKQHGYGITVYAFELKYMYPENQLKYVEYLAKNNNTIHDEVFENLTQDAKDMYATEKAKRGIFLGIENFSLLTPEAKAETLELYVSELITSGKIKHFQLSLHIFELLPPTLRNKYVIEKVKLGSFPDLDVFALLTPEVQTKALEMYAAEKNNTNISDSIFELFSQDLKDKYSLNYAKIALENGQTLLSDTKFNSLSSNVKREIAVMMLETGVVNGRQVTDSAFNFLTDQEKQKYGEFVLKSWEGGAFNRPVFFTDKQFWEMPDEIKGKYAILMAKNTRQISDVMFSVLPSDVRKKYMFELAKWGITIDKKNIDLLDLEEKKEYIKLITLANAKKGIVATQDNFILLSPEEMGEYAVEIIKTGRVIPQEQFTKLSFDSKKDYVFFERVKGYPVKDYEIGLLGDDGIKDVVFRLIKEHHYLPYNLYEELPLEKKKECVIFAKDHAVTLTNDQTDLLSDKEFKKYIFVWLKKLNEKGNSDSASTITNEQFSRLSQEDRDKFAIGLSDKFLPIVNFKLLTPEAQLECAKKALFNKNHFDFVLRGGYLNTMPDAEKKKYLAMVAESNKMDYDTFLTYSAKERRFYAFAKMKSKLFKDKRTYIDNYLFDELTDKEKIKFVNLAADKGLMLSYSQMNKLPNEKLYSYIINMGKYGKSINFSSDNFYNHIPDDVKQKYKDEYEKFYKEKGAINEIRKIIRNSVKELFED